MTTPQFPNQPPGGDQGRHPQPPHFPQGPSDPRAQAPASPNRPREHRTQPPMPAPASEPGPPMAPMQGNTPTTLPNLDIHERRAFSINGFLALFLLVALLVVAAWLVGAGFLERDRFDDSPTPTTALGVVLGLVALILMFNCLTIVAPGTGKVVQFFGSYAGTIRAQGLRLTIPFSTRRTVSVKVRNFETNVLKVNDADGNPINIAAIIVWRVTDTAKAVFAVENFEEFVHVQAEAALRHVTGNYPYDSSDPNQVTLLDSTAEVSDRIAAEVASRIRIAGLEVVETRISALSYAPEIAPAMLQRQQAAAVIAARERIVQGAVSIVQDALKQLEGDAETRISEERRVDIISNMLVVLTSETRVTPVINTGGRPSHHEE